MTNMSYLQDHKTFTSKSQLNEAVDQHLSHNNSKLNETDRDVFLFISRYSVKYYGASHLKVSTIADSLDKSRRTVQRSIKKMEGLQMIKKQSFMRRVSGGFGANLYLILPYSVTSRCHIDNNRQTSITSIPDEPKIENEPISLNTNNNLVTNTYQSDKSPDVIQSFYSRFKSLVGSFITNGQQLTSKLYGIYRAQSIKLMRFDMHKNKGDQLEQLAIQAINITMQATKHKKIRSITGYYSGVLQRLINKALFDDVRELHSEPVQFVIGSDKHEVNAMRDRLKHRQRLRTFKDMTLPF